MTSFKAPGTSSGYADVYHITAGPTAIIWFTDYNGNAVGRSTRPPDAITEFTVPTAKSDVYGITAGPDGNLWFTEYAADKIGSINPATDAITEYSVPGDNQIASGPDGNLWFTDPGNNTIGVAMLTTSQLVVTQSRRPASRQAPCLG